MKKKYISLFLALVMIVSLAVPTTLATESSLYDELMATGHVVDFEGVYTSATAEAKNAMTTQQITGVYNFLNSLYIDASASALLAKRDKLNTQILALPNAPELCTECGTLGGHTGGCSLTPTPEPTQEPTPTPEAGEPTPTPEVEVTPEPTEEPTPSAFEQIMAGATTTDMLITMNGLIETDLDAVFALTFEEIDAIAQQAKALDSALSSQDTVDLLDTLTYLPNSMASVGCPDCGQTVEHAEDCPRALAAMMPNMSGNIGETTIESNTTWSLTGDVTLNGTVTIKNGAKLTISTPNSTARMIKRGSGFTGAMFVIKAGGTLEINGYGMQTDADSNKDWTNNCVIIDGGSVSDVYSAIQCSGSLIIRDAAIRNNYANQQGGAIQLGPHSTKEKPETVSVEVTRTLIDNCKATNGSAIMLVGHTKGSADIWQSTIRNCVATNSGEGGTIRTNGAGNAVFTIRECVIANNTSGRLGGGIYWNANGANAKLTVTNSVISNNKTTGTSAKGGGMFLEGSNMEISSTDIIGNSSETGGGVCINSYSGGMGVGMESTDSFNLVIGSGVNITDNTATKNGGGVAMTIHSSDPADGYTYNIRIEDGAVIENNIAGTSGGAIWANLIHGKENTAEYNMNVEIAGGTIHNNTATNGDGGAIYLSREYDASKKIFAVDMTGGTVTANKAHNGDGGAVYVSGGKFTMSGGTLGGDADDEANIAINGGGIYVNGGSATVSGGTIQKNSATTNGGGLYVSGSGGMTISGGTITENTATNGGGAYVTGGSIQMTGGTITANTATTNGGGVAVDGGGFTMISGTMTGNKATGSASLGGGAYTKGGSVIIGVQNCSGAGEKHSITHTNLTHPTVSNNEAGFGGGGLAAQGGDVTLYCGTVSDNTALSKGTGHNVFMNSGSQGELTHYLDSTNVGQETDHDIVQIGGKLNVVSNELGGDTTSVNYYSNYKTTEKPSGDVWPAETPNGYWVNLPYCPPEWEAYQNTKGLTFVGWTTTPSDPIGDCSGVRDKGDYKFIGDPVEIKDGLKFYAVWAPMTNNLTFDSAMLNYSTTGDYIVTPVPTDLSCYVDGAELTGISTSNTYNYNVLSAPGDLVLNKPNVPGYDFLGWVLKADTGAISNWNSDNTTSHPSSVYLLSATGAQTDRAGNSWSYDENGTLTIDMNYNFGHLTFVALLKEQAVTLTYVAVGPDGKPYGELNPHTSDDVFGYTETFGAATGTATPVTAMPAYGYKFEGWHTDEDCTIDVGSALVSGEKGVTITPKKNADGVYESGTFYALFDFHLADLYLTKTATGTTDSEQRYLFKVYEVVPGTGTTTTDKYLTTVVIPNGGTVVINDLFIGTTYKVVEDTAWSWRHDPETEGCDSQTIEIVPNAEDVDINKLAFTNIQNRDYWLTSDDYQLNSFGMAVN